MPAPSSYNTAQQLFLADLVRNLYQNNAFLLRSRNWNAFTNGKTVNWNQSGAKPKVIINRSSTALAPARRVDVLRSYDLDEYQTQPTIVDWTEEMVVNYALRADVIDDHVATSREDLAERILYHWANGASEVVESSGASRPAVMPGATGNRKGIAYKDFLKALEVLRSQSVVGQMNCLVPSHLISDVYSIEQFISRDYLVRNNVPIQEGAVGRILGFDVFERAQGPVFDDSGNVQLPKADDNEDGRLAVATDSASLLFWGSDYVTRSISTASNTSVVPAHGGVELSATLIAGGRKFRNGGEGIVAVVEAPSA